MNLRILASVAVAGGAALCFSAGFGGPPLSAQPQAGFTFGLIGDLGYAPVEEPWFDNVRAELNRDSRLAFVVHVCDLSSPYFACTDEIQARRLAQFNESAHPFIYTPGDNEWTDCHDEQGLRGYDPLERLAKLRTVFFRGEESLGQRKLALVRQSGDPAFSKYRENVRWDMGGITFLTLHVVGSNNGLGRAPDGDAEYAERTRADIAWLAQGFDLARQNNSRAVMVFQQANVFEDLPPLAGVPQDPNGFSQLRASLAKAVGTFDKPVVLVHGDSHYFRLDKPLPQSASFTRLETFGSPHHHWVHVTVDPSDSGVFTVRPRIVAASVMKR